MQKIYLVMGETGEWDDYSRWPVKAFIDIKKAEDHVANASKRAQEIHSLIMKAVDEDRKIPELENEYDLKMAMEYNGTSYFIVEILLQTD